MSSLRTYFLSKPACWESFGHSIRTQSISVEGLINSVFYFSWSTKLILNMSLHQESFDCDQLFQIDLWNSIEISYPLLVGVKSLYPCRLES